MEDAILADAPGAAIGQCEAGTAAPEPARPIHKTSTVYSAEFKAQAVSDFLKVRGRTTRAEFARSRGIPPGTFDGWYWKAMGLKRGHAKEPSAIAAAPIPGSPAGPGLLADLQFCKYALGVPGYRYVGWSALSGLPISTQTFCNWARGAAEAERC